MKDKPLSVKNDLLFKEIFKSADTVPLINFLSEVLGRPEDDFQTLVFAPEEQRRRSAKARLGVLDVHVSTPEGMDIDIEVQVLPDISMPERALFYCANMYHEHIQRGDDFTVLGETNVINIGVLGYRHFDDDRPHHTFKLLETEQHITLTETLRIDFLELPKAKGMAMDDLQAWMLFLNATTEDKELLEMLKGHSEPLRKAVVRFEELTADEKVRAAAFKREREILAEKSRMHTAKTEGLEEGRQVGRQEGRQEGVLSSASKLLQKGLPPEKVAELLDLPFEVVKDLKAK